MFIRKSCDAPSFSLPLYTTYQYLLNRAIALSFFASGMGAWVVYGSTEMGANPNLSWLGVLGYSGASAFPAIIICMIGPRIRAITGEEAFCTTDFGLVRYGRLMQLSIAAISVFYSESKVVMWDTFLVCSQHYQWPLTVAVLVFQISVHLSRL